MAPLGRRIWMYVNDPLTPQRLQHYFTAFSGRAFETFAGGGDRKAVANMLTADDVVAVSFLGVNIPPEATLKLLDPSDRTAENLLKNIPLRQNLWQVPQADVDKSSPAQQLWQYLDSIVGVGWVTAGKLMARKRPQLIPVFDRVVRDALMPRRSNQWWVSLWKELQDPALRQALAALKAAGGVPEPVSLLRVLDVAVWMAGPTGQPPTSGVTGPSMPSGPKPRPQGGPGH